jgi:hypothetical protein
MKEVECYTVFDEVTRKPLERITCCENHLQSHVKAGHIAIKGRFDWSTVLNGDGIPQVDKALSAAVKQEMRRTARLLRIEELERKQHRRVREILEDADPQLKAISQEIAALRAELSQPPESA